MIQGGKGAHLRSTSTEASQSAGDLHQVPSKTGWLNCTKSPRRPARGTSSEPRRHQHSAEAILTWTFIRFRDRR
jgi:hypothetical protein